MLRKFSFCCFLSLLTLSDATALTKKVDPRCNVIGSKLIFDEVNPKSKLFMSAQNGWKEINRVVKGWFFNDKGTPIAYNNQILRFIYVPAPLENPNLQIISVKTAAKVNDINHFVNLRKHHKPFGQVYLDIYQAYHRRQPVNSPELIHYHDWGSGVRSDSPDSTRASFVFSGESASSEATYMRRLLSISFRTSASKITCVPFSLGPNLAALAADVDGSDEVSLQLPFTIEVNEAKTVDGAGGSFTLVNSR
jgi:hypothetical protein